MAATTGLLGLLDRDEVAAVMAHELAHVMNRDTLIMTMTATIAGAISMLANFGLFFRGGDGRGNILALLLAVIVAPFAAMIVQLAISRTREYGADRGGAAISGNPRALASALAKLHAGAARSPTRSRRAIPPRPRSTSSRPRPRACSRPTRRPRTGSRRSRRWPTSSASIRRPGRRRPGARRSSALDPLGVGLSA